MPGKKAAKPPITSRVVSLPDTGIMLGYVSRWTVWRLLRDGELTECNVRGCKMVTRNSIDAFLRRGAKRRKRGGAK